MKTEYREFTTIRDIVDGRVLFYGTDLTLEFKPQSGETFRFRLRGEDWKVYRVVKVVRNLQQTEDGNWDYDSQIWIVPERD